MPHGIPWGAMCVQRFDDSLKSAIHITYRVSLRSSSMPEPRDPLLKVVNDYIVLGQTKTIHELGPSGRAQAWNYPGRGLAKATEKVNRG